MRIKAKIKENITGFMNTLGKKPKDKPLENTPSLLSTNPKIKTIIDAKKADTVLKNTP